MKSYDEMAKDVLCRIEKYNKKKHIKRKRIAGVTISFCCMLVISLIGIQVIRTEITAQKEDDIIAKPNNIEVDIKTDVGDEEPEINTDTENEPKTESKKWPEKQVKPETSDETCVIIPWSELEIFQKYSEIVYQNERYSTRSTEIDADNVGESLSTIEAKTEDYESGEVYTTYVSLYAVNNISDKYAVAVRFEDDSKYYVYVNSYYKPNNLEDLINGLDLKRNLSFGSVYYRYKDEAGDYSTIEFTDVEDETVWNMLLSDTSVKNVYSDTDPRVYIDIISAGVDIPLLGYKNIALSATEDGYIITNILDTGKAFYIGEEKVTAFVEYVINNCTGYELVYDAVDTEE